MFRRILSIAIIVVLFASAGACAFPLPGPSNPATQAPAEVASPAVETAAPPAATEIVVTPVTGAETAAPAVTPAPGQPTNPPAATLPPLATTAPAETTAPGVQPTLVPAATQAPQAGQNAGEAGGGLAVPQKYTLQRGEYPVCIAQRFNVDPVELMRLNNLYWWQIFFSGTILKLPQDGVPYPGNRSLHVHPAVHYVQYGQNLNSIACYYGDVTPEAIAQANGLTAPYKLRYGQKLNIP